MKKMKVFVADDHTLFRQGIISILREGGVFEITGEADSIQRLLSGPELKSSTILTLTSPSGAVPFSVLFRK
jgi:DNA-binding NarL/FixJ family response regulator